METVLPSASVMVPSFDRDAIACYCPSRAFVDHYVAVTVSAVSCISFVIDECTFQCAAVGHVEVKVADGIPDYIALHILAVCGKVAVGSIGTTLTPSTLVVVSCALQEEFTVIIVCDIYVF